MPLMRITLIGALCAAFVSAACGGSDNANATPRPRTPAGAAATATRDTTPRDTALIRSADHGRIQGSPSAPLWMVEVSDFQCPYCREWHAETYPTIVREYVKMGKVRLAYINFPLSGHKNAWPAAEAAMCVSAQGKFWEMHDALFATQTRWEGSSTPSTLFDSLAASVGADTAAYHKCVSSHAMRPLIQADAGRAEESGVNSTPSFLIGGHMIAGAQPTEVFRQALDQALKTAAK